MNWEELIKLLSEEEKKELIKSLKEEKDVVLISSYPLTNEEKEKFRKIFSIDKRNIKNIINPEIIGGFIIELDGRVFDFSLRSRLVKFKKILYESI